MEKKMRKIKGFSFLYYIALIVLTLFPGNCKKAILTAPDNATLVVTVNPTVIPLGGQATVTVVGYKASGTPVPDGTIVSYDWDLGDGTAAAGQTITHQYGSSGTYTVLLKVTDNDGNTAGTTRSIPVGENENPVASFFYSPTNPAINEEVYFSASDSYDPDGTIVSYEWDFGDNSTGSGPTVTHRYSGSGTYTVHLRVTRPTTHYLLSITGYRYQYRFNTAHPP
jgi:chitinase